MAHQHLHGLALSSSHHFFVYISCCALAPGRLNSQPYQFSTNPFGCPSHSVYLSKPGEPKSWPMQGPFQSYSLSLYGVSTERFKSKLKQKTNEPTNPQKALRKTHFYSLVFSACQPKRRWRRKKACSHILRVCCSSITALTGMGRTTLSIPQRLVTTLLHQDQEIPKLYEHHAGNRGGTVSLVPPASLNPKVFSCTKYNTNLRQGIVFKVYCPLKRQRVRKLNLSQILTC